MSMETSIRCLQSAAIGVPINKVRISTGNKTQTLDTLHKRWRNGCLWKHQLDTYGGVNYMPMEVSIGCLWRRQLDTYGSVNQIPIEVSIGYLQRQRSGCLLIRLELVLETGYRHQIWYIRGSEIDVYGNVNQMPMEVSTGCLQRRQLDGYGGINWMPMEASTGCLWRRQLDAY